MTITADGGSDSGEIDRYIEIEIEIYRRDIS
jgi:hypothetical protein